MLSSQHKGCCSKSERSGSLTALPSPTSEYQLSNDHGENSDLSTTERGCTILQGEYDPVTPPSNGMLAAQTLSKSDFFLFPGVGHGVSSPTSNCPYTIIQAFWDHPTEKPDASCISSMPEPAFT
jgi:hypothetical protein